ncbi:hypothetical protein [Occultella gossypii]|uniref:Uncharacterized protein n=1 Tax=Occultella gossypii TaxID=2800820 RepID=A0ABS7SA88_9MICO|nr:hypothetical protein [Occultella gossypii]MBZ2197250.1 hypothetical protein [Occultella gossypii]
MATVTTPEQWMEAQQEAFEQGHWLIVVENGWRPWIVTEDDRGNSWAHSWHQEDEVYPYKSSESLRLPLEVLAQREVAPEVRSDGTLRYPPTDDLARYKAFTEDVMALVAEWACLDDGALTEVVAQIRDAAERAGVTK